MSPNRRIWFKAALFVVLGIVGLFGLARDLHADDLRESTSLKFVPADVSFYSSSLRNKEQLDLFQASNAYQKLRNLPLVSFGLSMFQGQWENSDRDEIRKAKELWESEENQQLVQVLADAVSHEVFVYGDRDFVESAKLIQEFQRVARAAQVRAARDDDRNEEAKQEVLNAFLEKIGEAKAPSTIVGFRISDSKLVEAQIARLEKHLGEAFNEHPELEPLKERLSRQEIGDASFLILTLDGELIPWDRMPDQVRDRIEEPVRDALKKMKLTIGLGVKNGYLLFATGASLDHVQRMGQGKLLADRPELEALRKHADRRIVNVSYASQDLMRQANSVAGQIDDMVTTAETLLPMAKLDESSLNAITSDLREFATEIKSFIPKAGAVSSFTFLTDRGYEGFSHNWSENKGLDGSKKLDILNHVGGEPIGFFAARGGKYSANSYEWAAKWLVKAFVHAEKHAIPKLSDTEKQDYERIRDRMLPLVKRLDKTTREDLLPAFQNGEGALVLDAKAKSNQWHQNLPSTRVALPMLELAMVYTVSDTAALKRAAKEYFAIAQQALDIAHELDREKVPSVQLPAPQRESIDGGEIYTYSIPEQVGLDKQLAPNAGLTSDTLVLSAMPELTKRLLKSTPVKGIGPLADTDRPLASASYFNVAAFLEALSPWVNYGVRIAGQAQGEDNPQARVAMQMVAGNVTPIIDLLKCFGESASVTYIEGNAVVTHSATNFHDAN